MVRRYKNRDNWQYQPVDQARPEDWSVQFEVRERQIERYITLNIVCSWVTNGLSLKLKDDLLKLKNPSLESPNKIHLPEKHFKLFVNEDTWRKTSHFPNDVRD
ncbi:hypothetical protein YC2023_024871 [Brassica napus]